MPLMQLYSRTNPVHASDPISSVQTTPTMWILPTDHPDRQM